MSQNQFRLNHKSDVIRRAARIESLEARRMLSHFVVTNVSDDGAGSLRQAITDANGNSGADFIDFNIPGSGVHTISPASALPDITDAVTIDGYTQPGASANTLATGDNATIKIELNGPPQDGIGAGFNLNEPTSSTVRGLSIFGFTAQIAISQGSGTIEGNFIGIHADGITPGTQGDGINLYDGTSNRIGGPSAASRNIIAAFTYNGIYVDGYSFDGSNTDAVTTGTVIQGNYIGTNRSGTIGLTSTSEYSTGIYLVGPFENGLGSSGTLVGGSGAGEGNLICSVVGAISLGGCDGNVVRGNTIGVSANGSPLANVSPNIYLGAVDGDGESDHNIIGGRGAGEGNIIANASDSTSGYGVFLKYGVDNLIAGNSIFNNAQAAIKNRVEPLRIVTLTAATSTSSTIFVAGSYASGPANTSVVIDIYSNAVSHGVGLEQAQTYLGSTTVTTNGSGNASFATTLAASVPPNYRLTATGTPAGGNTSTISGEVVVGDTHLLVSNTNDFGAGSLYQAILDANVNPDVNQISFRISPTSPDFANGVFTIRSSSLPAITNPVTIDGSTQTTYTGDTNPSGPEVQISMSGTASSPDGLALSGSSASGSTINSLAIDQFSGNGIKLSGVSNCTLTGCYIGVDPTGTTAQPNAVGVLITGSGSGNTIGGTSAATRNIISGNTGDGVQIGTPSQSNVIQGNYIGTDAAGLSAVHNGGYGIRITGSGTNAIGGLTAGVRNVISGNALDGIVLFGGNANTIQGNLIGLKSNGSAALGNGFKGIGLFNTASNNIIGGSTAAVRNIISGNGDAGVSINGTSTGNHVQGNYIGTNATGTAIIGNALEGIDLVAPANNNFIGGTNAGEGNLLSGNRNGIGITSNGNAVAGNYIGTDASGTTPLGNVQAGISLYNAAQTNMIGGTTAGARNIISGNGTQGVGLFNNGTSQNTIYGNYIGTDVTGTGPLPNHNEGVTTYGDSVGPIGNIIGGFGPGQGNVIAFNTYHGVWIGNGEANLIRGNSIHDNGYYGIELGNFGPAINDPMDADTGPNTLLNTPVLSSIQYSTQFNQYFVTGTLNSNPNTLFNIDFYSSATADPSTYGEGAAYLTTATVTTDAQGNASFTQFFSTPIQYLTATTNDVTRGTSEFSQGIGASGFSASPGANYSFTRNPDGSQTLTINSGTVTFDQAASQGNPNFTIHVINTGGRTPGGKIVANANVIFNSSQTLAALIIDSGASATMAAGGGRVLKTNSLSISGSGTLDLNNNEMIIDYSTATPLHDVEGWIHTARAGGAWTGGGITSTSAKTMSPTKNTTLGAMEASSYESLPGNVATFAGVPIDNTAVLIRYTYYGDANFNGKVDGSDYARIDATFNAQHSAGNIGGWLNGDFDFNGKVDGADYSLIDAAFNSQGVPLQLTALPSARPTTAGRTGAAGRL